MNSMLYSEKYEIYIGIACRYIINVHLKCIYSDIVYITISALSFNHTSTRNTMVMGWRRSWYADSGVFNTLADTMSELMNWLCRDIFRYLQSKDNIFSRNYNISRWIGGGGDLKTVSKTVRDWQRYLHVLVLSFFLCCCWQYVWNCWESPRINLNIFIWKSK